MGNMGMADNEYHEKMMRLGQTPTHRKQNVEYWRARSRVAEARCAQLEAEALAFDNVRAAYDDLIEERARLQQALDERNELILRITDHAEAGYQEHLARRSAWAGTDDSEATT